MKKENIHLVNRYFSPVTAGIETTLVQLLRHFDPEKYSVTVHTSANTLSETNILPPRDTLGPIKIVRYPAPKNIFIPNLPYFQMTSLVLTNFTLVPHVFILSFVLLLQIFGLRHFTFTYFPCGGFTPEWPSFSFFPRLIKQSVHRVIGRLFLNLTADRVIAISNWEKNALITAGIKPSLIHFMPLGVEDEAFSFSRKKRSPEMQKAVADLGPYIIQVSRIHPIKNIETTIRALSLMQNPLSYVVVGAIEDRQYIRRLQTLIKEKGLTKKVIFVGKVSVTDKYFLIDHSLAMVHMSHNESFGLSIYEAMSRGKICLVADNSALTEITDQEKRGFGFETNDSASLAAKLNYLRSPKGRKEIQKMGARNQQAMKAYRWENVAQNLQELIAVE